MYGKTKEERIANKQRMKEEYEQHLQQIEREELGLKEENERKT